jgi:hypothetical protein
MDSYYNNNSQNNYKEKYISFNHNDFNDIGSELFKLALIMTYAQKTNRVLVLFNEEYMNFINIFIKCIYKYDNEIKFNKKENFNFNIDYDDDNLFVDFNDIDKQTNYNHNLISQKVRVLLSLLITNNSNFINLTYNRINEIMYYFKEYKLDNYVCIDIKKNTYDKDYYERAYYRHFNNKKLIVRTDDIEWAEKNINFIDKSLIKFVENSSNKDSQQNFKDFIYLCHFNNYIIQNDYFSWWIAYLSNMEKKVIVPNKNNQNFFLLEWINQ